LVSGIRSDDLLSLTSEIVAAYLANNEVVADDFPALISLVYRGLENSCKSPQPKASELIPAVPFGVSVQPDHIVCLEDGKKLKMLKRHLKAHYNMTPAEYRRRWNLPADYPMIAPEYAARRSEIAKKSGLGQSSARDAALTRAEAVAAGAAPAPASAANKPEPSIVPIVAASDVNGRRKLLRPVFSTKPALAETPPEPDAHAPTSVEPKEPLDMLRAAIARQSCVTTTYNKRTVTLAPHIVYTRHDEPFLRAVTVALDGNKPRELKLGTFKVAGLGALNDSASLFVRHPDFSADDADYQGVTLAVIRPSARRTGMAAPAFPKAG
jgi:predicted transcriptional regulator